MWFMFEVYYLPPPDAEREAGILAIVEADGGRLDFRESDGTICLTYEFPELSQAEAVAERLRQMGEYVEGPVWYGD